MGRFIDRAILLNMRDVNGIDKESIIEAGDLEEITECMALGVNFGNNTACTLLPNIPIIQNNFDVFNLLVKSASHNDLHSRPSCDLEYTDKRTVGEKLLFTACHYNRLEMIKILLDLGVDINSTNCDQETPLYESIRYISSAAVTNDVGYSNPLEVVQELICRGANVNVISRYGSTLLSAAASVGAVSIVEELIKNGTTNITRPVSYAYYYPQIL